MAQMPEAIILRKTEETKTGVTYCIADVKTNADRIRSMSDEELADFLCYWDNCSSTEGLGYNTERVGDQWLCSAPGGGDIVGECQACAMAWLKSPVEEKE